MNVIKRILGIIICSPVLIGFFILDLILGGDNSSDLFNKIWS